MDRKEWDVYPESPDPTLYLPIRLTDGVSFYVASGGGGSGGLTDTQLRATPVPVSLSGTVAVTGTFWQATQPVSGTVTVTQGNTGAQAWLTKPGDGFGQFLNFISPGGVNDDETNPALRTSTQVYGYDGTRPLNQRRVPIHSSLVGGFSLLGVDGSGVTQPVSGTFFQATQPVSGSVSVSNFPATQAVTGTFFQGTQPVSLATNTPDVTDRVARLLGHVTVDALPAVIDVAAEASLATLVADIGTPTSDSPGAFTVLDQISRMRKASEDSAKSLKAILVNATPVLPRKTQTTLLHRS